MYVEVLPLMVSLEVEARTPHCADGEPGESLRGTGSVQGHGPGHEQKPGLKPALRPHSGDTGCTQAPWGLWVGGVGVTVWMGHGVEGEHRAAGGGGPLGALVGEGSLAREPQAVVTSLP